MSDTAPDYPAAQAPGSPGRAGRFRLVRVLGAGGFATVWLGHDPALDADVAVKILADNWSQHADVRERFLSEARLLRRVDSDRVVRVYDVGTLDDGRPFLVMSYAAGGTLAQLLATAGGEGADARNGAGAEPVAPHGLSTDDRLGILAELVDGLTVLHARGIVHRDLNPHNVLVTDAHARPPRVVLADLGLAKDLGMGSGLTRPGGTDGYRAPEQDSYGQVTEAADIWALGRIADVLLPERPEPLASVLRRCAATDPDERPSLTELEGAITAARGRRPGTEGAAASGLGFATPGPDGVAGPGLAQTTARPATGSTAPRPVGHPTPTRGTSGRRRALVAAVALLALLVASGTWWATHRPTRFEDSSGRLTLTRAHGWESRGTATVPGATSRTGFTVTDGESTALAAWARSDEVDGDLLGADAVAGCSGAAPTAATLAGHPGEAAAYACSDGRVVERATATLGDAVLYLEVSHPAGRSLLTEAARDLSFR